ncbi:hypothetical protein EYF80_061483 [Liparis tanakae]|uniref:Uncharacterized protein n=1 Tax=Liparis tanakae TaxID=230148 RepID=A0A4Z2EHV4_9TELE|nr:hypothetical protein EYF80_061483 [Liparis tanakae]
MMEPMSCRLQTFSHSLLTRRVPLFPRWEMTPFPPLRHDGKRERFPSKKTRPGKANGDGSSKDS